MGEVITLLPSAIRTIPTRSLEQSVAEYSRALRDPSKSDGDGNRNTERLLDILVDEWERVQIYVVDDMTKLRATPESLQAACRWIVTRVFDAADARMRADGYSVPRELICEIFTSATPDTPVTGVSAGAT